MEKIVQRFMDYTKFDTTSDAENAACPSSKGQLAFGKYLVKQLKEIGLSDAGMDGNGYVMATLPATIDEKVPVIGFIAHLDTSPDMSGADVKPQVVRNYDGRPIVLNAGENIVLSPDDFPELTRYIGQDLITTDGTTLLGADDKAGICAIVTAMEYLVRHPEIPHGTVKVGFTPDEEIGRGADLFDVARFGADFAYTIDGSGIGELEYETFNAAQAKITVRGRNVHPGQAKNKMKNALHIAMELHALLPPAETPGHTEGYEGFYHLNKLAGDVEETKMTYIIRDHDRAIFTARKDRMEKIAAYLNDKYGPGTVLLDMKDQYYNMREKLEPVMHIVDMARQAISEVGLTPKMPPIRGGTDGARLSFMGLPCPNVFYGGHNAHGKYEFLPIHSLQKSMEVILKIIEINCRK